MVESRNLSSLEAALKYALEYEARYQINPHFPINNITENPYYPSMHTSNNPYPNHNYPYKVTNTYPRAQSPAPVSKNNLNFDSARQTDAVTGMEETERQTSVTFHEKQEKSSAPNLVENPQ